MTYFNKIGIYGADSPSIDAFGRWRQSGVYTLFDSKMTNTSGSLVWDSSGSVGGYFEYSQSEACVYLKVPATAGSRATRQSKEWFNYQPGKSQLVVCTGLMNPEAGVVKRMGYFNDNNGLFFETSGSGMYVVKRSNTSGTPVNTKVSQSAWNLDKMDGTGVSGITKDYSKAQIFFLDFEWLGVGRVRFGHYHGGAAHYVHEFDHENDITSVYMKNPNLPLRYEIQNLAGTAKSEMKQICASVASEGGLEPNGITRAIDTGGTSVSIAQNVTGSLVAIRLKDGWLGSSVSTENVEVFSTTANLNMYWMLAFNPSGSGAFTWQDIPNSPLQKATNVANVNIKVDNTFPNSVKIASGYVATTTQAKQVLSATVDSLLKLGSKINGTKDVIVLGVCPINNSGVMYGSLTVREIR